MTYEIYQGIFIIGAILCIKMLIITIIQLIRFRISKVFFEIEKEITYVYTTIQKVS